MSAVNTDPMESSNGALDDKNGSANGNCDESTPAKSLPKLSYSRELMMKLKNHPKSKEKPAAFDLLDMVSKTGMWDPEQWMTRTSSRDPKRPTPGTVGALIKAEQLEKKHVREEGDEFCFTPQRRSFVSGCHVVPSRRQDPEPAPTITANESGRESSLTSRRVGSGRLTGRESEVSSCSTAGKDSRGERREPLRSTSQRERTFDRDQQRNYSSRTDVRDKALDKDRRAFDRPTAYEREYSRGNRYQDRRKNHDEDDTPEWFHGGPTSQHDTIELRGFEEEQERLKNAKSKKDVMKERQPVAKKVGESLPVNGSSRPETAPSEKVAKEDKPPAVDQISRKKTPPPKDKMDFDIEDFLKMDPDGFNGLGLGSTESDETSRGSKSSRWFSKSQEQTETSSSTSLPEKPMQHSNQDAARSLLEMLQKGNQQPQDLKKILTAEELERTAVKLSNKDRGVDDGMTVFNKLLAQVQDSAPKPQVMMNNAPTEQDILANLLGKKMKIESHSQPHFQTNQQTQQAQQQPQQDALAKFLQQQHTNQMHHQNQQHLNQGHHHSQPSPQFPFQNLEEQKLQQHQHQHQPTDVQSMMRDVANGLLNHPQGLQQLQMIAMQNQHQQQRGYGGSPQPQPPKSTSSSSPLSFTPTAVMRKMTAEKDKIKSASQDKGDGGEPVVITSSCLPTNSNSSTSNRLTGRTASQVQGAARVSNQLGMNENPLQQPQQQQQLLTGRPLVKGQEGGAPFQQPPHIGNRTAVPPFSNQQLASNAAITGVAVKLFEQQQQHQLLAAAVAASAASAASQNQQMKQQQMFQQQQQRTSPLQQTLLAYASGMQSNLPMQNRAIPPNVPVANRTHFRPIHPQPMVPPISAGYSSYMTNQSGGPQSGQSRPPSGLNSSNQFYGFPPSSNLRGQAQGLNALAALQQQAYAGNRSPNMLQGGNPLARWFPPEILSQAGSGMMPNLPPMPNQKILSLEELERLHTSPMSH